MSRRLSVNGDGDDDGVTERREIGNSKRKRKRRALFDGYTYKRGLKRAKKAVLSPFNKFQKLFKRDTRSCSTTTSSTSSSSPSDSRLPSNTKRLGSYCCCLCMSKEPPTVDVSSDDIDPNDPRISYVYVKTLLEQNEFYSKECNTHFVD